MGEGDFKAVQKCRLNEKVLPRERRTWDSLNRRRIYTGFTYDQRCMWQEPEKLVHVVIVEEGEHAWSLPHRYDLCDYGSGFTWGVQGEKCLGALQLCVALLADATGDDKLATDLHPQMAQAFIHKFTDCGWRIPVLDIWEFVNRFMTAGSADSCPT